MSDDSQMQADPSPSGAERALNVLFTAPFLTLLVLAMLLWAGFDYYIQLDQATWIAAPATVTKVERRHDRKQEFLDVTYNYAFANQDHTGQYTYEVHELDFDETRIPDLETTYSATLSQPNAAICFVDSSHPEHSVLERAQFTRWTASKLVFALVLSCYWAVMVRMAGKEEPYKESAHIHLPAFTPKEPQVLYPISPPALNDPLSDTRSSLLALLPMLLIGDYNADLPQWWVALVMASVLMLTLAIFIVPGWRARRRNPASTLELDAAPIAAGEYFHGHLRLDTPVPVGTPFRIILRPHFGNSHTAWPIDVHDYMAVFRSLDAIVRASGTCGSVTSVPLRLPLPKIHTRNEQCFSPTHWYLQVHASLQDRDYKAAFELPLHGKVPGNAADEFLANPHRAEALAQYRAEVFRRARIFLKYTEDTLHIRMPAPRLPLKAILATCLGAILLAPFYLRIQFGMGPILGFVIILWSLFPWLSSTQLYINRDTLKIRSGLLRLLRLRRPRVIPIGLDTSWSFANDHIATHLIVHPVDARKRAVAKWLPNQYIAELLLECICEFMVDENRVESTPAEGRFAG